MYIGDGQEVEASINEFGGVTGGQPGDQTGWEFTVRSYRNYPWDCVLRYPEQSEKKKRKAITSRLKPFPSDLTEPRNTGFSSSLSQEVIIPENSIGHLVLLRRKRLRIIRETKNFQLQGNAIRLHGSVC